MKHLLQVEDVFQVAGRLVIAPGLLLPERFSDFTDTVTIAPPGLAAFSAQAHFEMAHFRPGGFRLLLVFPGMDAQALPVGSMISVSASTNRRLNPSY